MKVHIFPFILVLSLFCSCGADNDTEKKSLSEVKQELADYSFSEHDNLKFVCSVPEISADKVYTVTMKSRLVTDDDESRQMLLDLVNSSFGTNESFDRTSLMEFDGVVDCAYMEGSPGGLFYKGCSVFQLWDYPDGYNYGRETDPPRVYTSYPVTELPEERFEMFDGSTLTVKEAAEDAEKYLEKLKPFLNDGAGWRLKGACIEAIEGQNNAIFLRYENVFDGLPVSDDAYITDDRTVDTVLCPQLQLLFTGKNRLTEMYNKYHCLIDKKEELSKLLPLSEAERLASEALAPKAEYTVTEADLKYVCVTRQGEDIRVYRPMWSFTLKAYPPIPESRDLFPRLMCFVDAADGTVRLSDGMKGELSVFEG